MKRLDLPPTILLACLVPSALFAWWYDVHLLARDFIFISIGANDAGISITIIFTVIGFIHMWRLPKTGWVPSPRQIRILGPLDIVLEHAMRGGLIWASLKALFVLFYVNLGLATLDVLFTTAPLGIVLYFAARAELWDLIQIVRLEHAAAVTPAQDSA